jgi:hypothetical protein
VTLALAASAGCRTPPAGSSSFEMLAPITAPQASTDKMELRPGDIVFYSISPSSKGELSKPVYPSAALAARAGSCEVFVTITIDTSGAVTEVTPSWQRLNIPGRFSADFLAAVRSTVSAWRFEPARHVYWRRTADGNLAYLYSETIPAMIDVKFTFDASGTVR